MPDDQINHFTNLVVGFELLLTPNLDNELLTDINNLFKDFVRDMDKIYMPEALLSGVHELIHLTNDVKKNGNLIDFNCFSFEDLNRQLGCLIKGKSNVGIEIINALTILKLYHQSVSKLLNEKKNEVVNLFEKIQTDKKPKNTSIDKIDEKNLKAFKSKNINLTKKLILIDCFKTKNGIVYTSLNYKKCNTLDFCIESFIKFGLIEYFCSDKSSTYAVSQTLSKLTQPFFNIKYPNLKHNE
ncbi:unnamed protein product [Brachionus calyciflorus]|uniref:Uncharacterized protein n=1 Tax=Brachionus calyciflorus TaxID=104777 RepID=A0A814GM87_9BILA|nr:unnamed protein product [Brachionus calyciflorus]